jgi:hypothetical protein
MGPSPPTTWDLQALRRGQKPIALPGEIRGQRPTKVTRAESTLAQRKARLLLEMKGHRHKRTKLTSSKWEMVPKRPTSLAETPIGYSI